MLVNPLVGALSVPGPLYGQDRILQAMGNVTLALHLLCERADPTSFWQPYIRSLPQDYDTPLYYQQEDVQLLLGTQAVQDVLSQYKNTARQYAYFYKLVQVRAPPTFCIFIALPRDGQSLGFSRRASSVEAGLVVAPPMSHLIG